MNESTLSSSAARPLGLVQTASPVGDVDLRLNWLVVALILLATFVVQIRE